MGPPGRPPRRHQEPDRPQPPVEVFDQGEAAPGERRAQGRVAQDFAWRSETASPAQLFSFCQLEFSFALGPPDGRYLARGTEGDELDVVVISTLGAPRRHLVRGRRPKRIEPGDLEPEPVPVSRATAIAAQGLETEQEATRWLERCRADEEGREEVVERALLLLNRTIQAHRLAAADPYAHDVGRRQAERVRLGYGSGEQVADGRWSTAYSVPPPRRRQRTRELLAPHEELARIIGGRKPAYPSEDLALRARLDLDQGRVAASALQLAAALDALTVETSEPEGGHDNLRAIAERRAYVRQLAEGALRGTLGEADRTELTDLVAALERALRHRRHRT